MSTKLAKVLQSVSDGVIDENLASTLTYVSTNNSSREEIAEMILRGSIRFQFDKPWKQCHGVLNTLLNSKTTIEEENVALQHSLMQTNALIAEINTTLEDLQMQIQNAENKAKKINKNIKTGRKKLQCMEQVQQLLPASHILQELEQEFILAVQEQAEIGKYDFSALTEESESPKLSLVFNAFGLSRECISNLADLTALEFLTEDIPSLANFYGITDFQSQKDLCYIQHMMQENQILWDHSECPVCFCENPEQLRHLLEEHNLVYSDTIEKHIITGKRLIFTNYNDIQNVLKPLSQDHTMKAVNYVRKLHIDFLVRDRNKEKHRRVLWLFKGPYNCLPQWRKITKITKSKCSITANEDEAWARTDLFDTQKRDYHLVLDFVNLHQGWGAVGLGGAVAFKPGYHWSTSAPGLPFYYNFYYGEILDKKGFANTKEKKNAKIVLHIVNSVATCEVDGQTQAGSWKVPAKCHLYVDMYHKGPTLSLNVL